MILENVSIELSNINLIFLLLKRGDSCFSSNVMLRIN